MPNGIIIIICVITRENNKLKNFDNVNMALLLFHVQSCVKKKIEDNIMLSSKCIKLIIYRIKFLKHKITR